MRKIILPLVFFLFLRLLADAQQYNTTVYTPKGTPVSAMIIPEMSSGDIAYVNNLAASQFPNAQRLADASATYNCHAYAWHLSAGGNPRVWINTPGDDTYWNDGSYMEVCNEIGSTKVSYYAGDHSANNVGNGYYESKWGQYPLMRHTPTYAPPAYNVNQRKYYIKTPPINGPYYVCNSSTYTIDNLPAGSSVSWSVPSSIIILSGQGTNTLTVKQNGYGQASISAQITNQCGSPVTVKKDVFVSAPYFDGTVYSGSARSLGTWNYITGFSYDNTGMTVNVVVDKSSSVSWWQFNNGPNVTSWSYNGNSLTFKVTTFNPSTTAFTLYGSDACGLNTQRIFWFEYRGGGYIVSPNPSDDILTISYDNSYMANNKNAIPPDFEVKLLNSQGNVIRSAVKSKHSQNITLDTQDIPNGTYFLHIITDKNHVEKQQVIIQH